MTTIERVDRVTDAMAEAAMMEHRHPRSTWKTIVQAALAAAPSPWRPIETAPKDGKTHILVCDPSGAQCVCWVRPDGVVLTCWDHEPFLNDDEVENSHWRPLSPPPEGVVR